MEDIQNKADYDVKNIGVSYTHSGTLEEKKDTYNKNGLIPSLSPGAKNEASSTTHASIGQGTITTTKEQINLSQINRDTQHSLNELGKIFDKKEIEEKQELAKLFAKNADELLHDFSKDGSIDKTLAHGLVSEIASQIAGNKAGSGFLAGAANEALINKIDQLAKGNPAAAQWISAVLGATVNAVTGGNANTGAMVAQSGTQWNYYGKRRDDTGNMLAVGKVAAILQNDGTYQYVINVNGKDVPIKKEELPPYTSVWIEDKAHPGLGQTYIVNGNGTDSYFEGTFSGITFGDAGESPIYHGSHTELDELGTVIPGLHPTDTQGTEDLPVRILGNNGTLGTEKMQEGYDLELGLDGAWYADGYWVPKEEVLKYQLWTEAHDMMEEQGENVAIGLSGSAGVGIGKLKPKVNVTKNPDPSSRAGQFEKSISHLPTNERVAMVRQKMEAIVKENGWSPTTTFNTRRKVYGDGKGNFYSADTQHGRIEKFDDKGNHQGEFDIDLNQRKPADKSGKHDLHKK